MMAKKITLMILVLFICSGLIINCSDSESKKGTESEMPIDGSADTWRNPTNNGTLVFGTVYEAEFTADTLYHAWNFTLSDIAEVSVWLNTPTAHFDTVMYLYQWNADENSWGSYIARNDDHEGNLWSRLDENLGAGEYRVMVKGYKEILRGSFEIEASCQGAGCPGESEPCPEFENNEPPSGEYSVAPQCVPQLQTVLTGELIETQNRYVGLEEYCYLPAVVQLSWEHYYSYWDDLGLIYEWFIYDELPIEFDVTYSQYESGWLVTMYADVDESKMLFVYDKDENLLLWYLWEQSPEWNFSCQPDDEVTGAIGEPDAHCIGLYLFGMTAIENPETGEGTTTGTTAAEQLPDLAAVGVLYYIDAQSLSMESVINYTYQIWPARDGNELMEISLSSEGAEDMTLTIVGDSEYGFGNFVYFEETSDGYKFSCVDIDSL
jgi:hypothetical protein